MSKNICFALSILLLTGMYGCTSAQPVRVKKDIEFRAFMQEKKRVDQELTGNAGYIMGEPKQADRTGVKDTRKVYVFEFTKDAEPGDTTKFTTVEDTSVTYTDTNVDSQQNFPKSPYVAPDVRLPEGASGAGQKGAGGFVEYTVEKDDTLQKISKKFYNSYSKWPQIYEVNKELIGNPDSIQPGLVIRIPME